MQPVGTRHSRIEGRLMAFSLTALTLAALGFSTPAWAAAPQNSIVKVVNGNFGAAVDNGWVAYQVAGGAAGPSLRRYVQDASGKFTASGAVKIKTAGAGAVGNGALFNFNSVIFAPCPAVGAPSRCAVSNFGTSGVGLAFGQTTFGSASALAGWITDASATMNFTDVDFNTVGSITGAGADAVNGAYAVGWSQAPTTGKNHGLIMKLNTASNTFKVVSRTDLGTLGGPSSQALGISKNALHVVGIADDASGKAHAVYAPSNATSWTDITTGFPVGLGILKSRAFAVNDAGLAVGSATLRRVVGGVTKNVDIGFTYDVNTQVLKFIQAPDASVIPLNVLSNGQVVGNLQVIKLPGAPEGLPELHPFLYDGKLHDFGTMQLKSGRLAYSCRVNRPNNLGEMVGSCIPDNATAYGVNGAAFYIDALAQTPQFIDLNASIHANADAANAPVRAYTFGTATTIDDQHEIALSGLNKGGVQAAFIASKPAYNP